jgi:hypothetical protein
MTDLRQISIESGAWLARQLKEAGCEDILNNKICFATGQRQAMADSGEEIRDLAVRAWENYKNGVWDIPGEELAMQLLREKFGSQVVREKMLQWFMENESRRVSLIEALREWEESGRLPEKPEPPGFN